MKTPRINETARRKLIADIKDLCEYQPVLHPNDKYADAKFAGAAQAILLRMATILETGNPDAKAYLDAPDWVKEFEGRYREAMRRDLDDADEQTARA